MGIPASPPAVTVMTVIAFAKTTALPEFTADARVHC